MAADAVTMAEAARRLGVSRVKVWRLVREGQLSVHVNPLDRREKLIRMADLDRLTGDIDEQPRRFASDGVAAAPDAPHSDEIRQWLRRHWKPD